MQPLMVAADPQGRIFEHPDLAMVGAQGREAVAPQPEELSPLPEGSRLFTLPGSHPVGGRPEKGELVVVEEADFDESPVPVSAACTFPAPGWMRTLLPCAERGEDAPALPLWAYTALGFDPEGRGFVCAAVRVDDCPRWAPARFDDRGLAGRVAEMRDRHPKNRMIPHLARCAQEFHCFAAKNFFAGRWEMGLPIAPLCNADCRGCISLQTDDLFPASHERIGFVPTPEELRDIALPHLEGAELAVASFGQGCEGEPLLQAGVIERACRLIRERTARGTLHLNTNGSRPEWVPRLAAAGLESIRVSTNSVLPGWHRAYYRPETYGFEQVEDTVKAAVDAGLYTQINYLVFPGVTDLEAEAEALIEFCGRTGLHVIQMKNLCMDPDLYLDLLPGLEEAGEAMGMAFLLDILRRELPHVALRYFNRPREEWHLDPRSASRKVGGKVALRVLPGDGGPAEGGGS
ncbi:MAG: radical SAM protein [Candidatus Tectomicrobia bacterium]|uniref:Radical SAM protein n=1 Tax=Tectimicrobiota bacterium TaxID=2528274 RepID=A0A932HZ44_UNCTE|nr:radical SAM protein [Candidatus Tectomicrobia bacterium]